MGGFLVERTRGSSVMGGFPVVDVSAKLLFTAAIMVITFAVLPLVSSVGYKVGDDVIEWSSSNRTFHVGDTISFEYDHNEELYQHVVQVTPIAYQLCDATSPIAVFTTGNDSITFNNTGYYYFIFGPGTCCVQEQMLDIYVQPEEDHDNVSVTSTLAPPAVSHSSSASAAVAAAVSEPNPSSNDGFDDFTLYIMAWVLFVLWLSQSG